MAKKREKILSYRRAVWLNENPSSINLALCVKQSATALKSIVQRTIVRDDGQRVCFASIKPSKNGFFIHLTADTPGEYASVVPKKAAIPDELKVKTTAPPADAEFMDGDAFLYIKGNDVCVCATGIRDGAVRIALYEFFRAANIRKDSTMFDLRKVADVNKFELLMSQGIAEIELSATINEASVSYARRKTHAVGLLGAAAKQLKALVGKPYDVTDDSLDMTIVVKSDGRRKGLDLGAKRLELLATDLLNEQEAGDDFNILTKEGQRIGPKEIFMRQTVEIDAHGKSVNREQAWKELENFYASLDNSGALEQ